MTRFFAALLFISAIPLTAAPALADDTDSPWAGYGSIGVGLVPDYDGSKYYVVLPYAEARLNYDNYYLRYDGNDLRLNVVDDDTFHAGPMMGFRRGRHGVDSPFVSKFPRLDDTETVGGFVEWEHVEDDPRYGQSAVLMADYSVTDAPSGLNVVLRADARWPIDLIDQGLIVDLEGDATWSSHDYMRTYFGITPAMALASGLPAYSASSGLSQVGVALSVDQFLSRHWSVGIRSHYGRMLSSAAASPITAIAGSPDQFYIGAVFGYVL